MGNITRDFLFANERHHLISLAASPWKFYKLCEIGTAAVGFPQTTTCLCRVNVVASYCFYIIFYTILIDVSNFTAFAALWRASFLVSSSFWVGLKYFNEWADDLHDILYLWLMASDDWQKTSVTAPSPVDI